MLRDCRLSLRECSSGPHFRGAKGDDRPRLQANSDGSVIALLERCQSLSNIQFMPIKLSLPLMPKIWVSKAKMARLTLDQLL